MFRNWRKKHAMKKVKPGDGSALRPFHWWHSLWRTRFTIVHGARAADGTPHPSRHKYTVDVNYFDEYGRAALYTDDVQTAIAEMPAMFPVPDGVIDVASSTYGMRRVHLVLDSGTETQLVPEPRTLEHWRAVLDQRHPRVSRTIAIVSVVILIIGLVVAAPQALELLTSIDAVQDRVGTFTSPLSLPTWANIALGVAGVLAALERALSLRNHWLLDADTWILDL